MSSKLDYASAWCLPLQKTRKDLPVGDLVPVGLDEVLVDLETIFVVATAEVSIEIVVVDRFVLNSHG